MRNIAKQPCQVTKMEIALVKKYYLGIFLFREPNFSVLMGKSGSTLQEICRGICFFVSVRDCKAGCHKGSSSKATTSISGKYIFGINCQKTTGKSGNHHGKIVFAKISSVVFSERGVLTRVLRWTIDMAALMVSLEHLLLKIALHKHVHLPLTGARIPSGNEGSGVEEPAFPPPQKKGLSSQKNPRSTQGNVGKMEFSGSKRPFGNGGFFNSETLSSRFWGFRPL